MNKKEKQAFEDLADVINAAIDFVGSANYIERQYHAKFQVGMALVHFSSGNFSKIKWEEIKDE